MIIPYQLWFNGKKNFSSTIFRLRNISFFSRFIIIKLQSFFIFENFFFRRANRGVQYFCWISKLCNRQTKNKKKFQNEWNFQNLFSLRSRKQVEKYKTQPKTKTYFYSFDWLFFFVLNKINVNWILIIRKQTHNHKLIIENFHSVLKKLIVTNDIKIFIESQFKTQTIFFSNFDYFASSKWQLHFQQKKHLQRKSSDSSQNFKIFYFHAMFFFKIWNKTMNIMHITWKKIFMNLLIFFSWK